MYKTGKTPCMYMRGLPTIDNKRHFKSTMGIHMNGYAISGMSGATLTKNGTGAIIEGYSLKAVADDADYGEWAKSMAIVKGFENGIFIETEYRIAEASLLALSVKTGATLYLCHYEAMGCYGCIYYVNGKKMLDRITLATGNVQDTVKGNEFEGHATAVLIAQLFARLTGSGLSEAQKAAGTTYYFEPTTIKNQK
jgi:hypothetical protein